MQNVNFQDVEEFLYYLPENELNLVEFLRNLVHESLPEINEKLSYNVPYYYKHKRICFIWPSSVTWGNVKQDGVLFGFCQGNLLLDSEQYLEKRNRKQVFTKTFHSIQEIDTIALKTLLFEAYEIDAEFSRNKKP